MKKILFMIPNLMHGGAEKVLVNLVNNMDSNQFDITVMTLFDGGVNKQFLKEHIKYTSIYKKIFRGNIHYLKLFTPKQLFKRFIKEDYDIIVSYLEGPTARIVSGCDNPNTKLVSWIHVEQHTEKIACQAFRNYKEALECYQRFDKTICVSQEVRKDFLRLFDTKNECLVLYNTNETDMIFKQSKEAIEELVFDKEYVHICGVGKLMPNKGFDRLFKIHKRLVDEDLKVKTYILGVGPTQEKLEKYIQENKLTESCYLLGYKTNPYKYVANCDLFVCASFAEGFSTAATEALIVGTPVVTTNVAGMKEMLGENDEYGIVVDNDDELLYEAIRKIVIDKELRNHYQEKAVERGKKFSTKNTVDEVEKRLMSI